MYIQEKNIKLIVHDFDDSDNRFVTGLQNMGILRCSNVQEKMFDALKQHQNIFVHGQTGSGKTLGALLSVFMQIDPGDKEPQAVIVCSTHEAAIQLHDMAYELSATISVATVVQGQNGKYNIFIPNYIYYINFSFKLS